MKTKIAEKPYNSRDCEWNDTYTNRKSIDATISIIPSIASRVYGHYWGAGQGCREFLIGNELENSFYNLEENTNISQIIVKEEEILSQYQVHEMEAILIWISNCGFAQLENQKTHPFLFALPYTARNERRKLETIFFNTAGVPFLCIRPQAVIALYGTEFNSAIVVCFESPTIVSVVPVENLQVIRGESRAIQLVDSSSIESVCRVIDLVYKQCKNHFSGYKVDIVVTGDCEPIVINQMEIQKTMQDFSIHPNLVPIEDGMRNFCTQLDAESYFLSPCHFKAQTPEELFY